MDQNNLRHKILELVKEYAATSTQSSAFIPGQTYIPAAGKVLGPQELCNLVDASLDAWLTTGRYNEAFEKKLADYLKVKHVLTVNSGSSANLLAIAALTSPTLEKRSLKPGDEVVTVAAGFPTTLNPILQHNLVPVFVDVEIPTYNINVAHLENAISNKTKAIMLAHTLGNPFNLDEVLRVAKKYNLWLIEDCCDALGSTYRDQAVGSFGDIATLSFYPAHHITTGEGGAVFTNNSQLKTLIESFRDWGRDCWCPPGKDNTCKKRFQWQLGNLPKGYDHKYTYSHIGYNLKMTDMQAAIGLAQLEKLPSFVEKRRNNFNTLLEELANLEEYFVLPRATEKSNPSWFGFPIAVKEDAPFTRNQVIQFLEENKIGTRLLFGGNLTKQPAYKKCHYRIVSDLNKTDFVMNQVFWVGVWPELSAPHINYVISVFHKFLKEI